VELNATIFLQAAIFFLLLAWLSPMLFDPFLKLFDERDKRIVGAADEAKKLAGSADESARALEQKMQEAQAEARKVLTGLRAQAQAAEAKIIAEAREKADSKIDEAQTELFAASEDARRKLKDEAQVLSGQIVQKLLGRAA
jgi:F-type H+-transporting ATPase subunit b